MPGIPCAAAHGDADADADADVAPPITPATPAPFSAGRQEAEGDSHERRLVLFAIVRAHLRTVRQVRGAALPRQGRLHDWRKVSAVARRRAVCEGGQHRWRAARSRREHAGDLQLARLRLLHRCCSDQALLAYWRPAHLSRGVGRL
eukprot:2725104-Pleurochrysis_carterae.AAC.1